MRATRLAVVLLCSCATDPITHGIPNLRPVRAGYYRSGQPANTGEAWGYLRSIGITDVIKLNANGEGGGCDTEAARHGIVVHRLAIQPTSVVWQAVASFGLTEILRPDAEVMAKIEAFIRQNAPGGKRVVLIHCTHGWDRTGLVSGMVLTINGDMGKEAAWRYMLDTRFHRAHLGLWREWRAFDPSKGVK